MRFSLFISRLFWALIISLSLTKCQNPEKSSAPTPSDNQIVIGQIDSVYSNILGESRKIWVHLPTSAKNELFGEQKYPVLYLLDGSAHFHSVSGMVNQLSTKNGNMVVPEMVVVAITNTNRSLDLTPTHVDIDTFTGDSIQYPSGGGNQFLDFIEQELMPYVERNYPVTSYRTFVGHSFGGLSVINALTTKPAMFDNYIAIDPSLWWDNQAFMRTTDSLLKTRNYDGKSLYIGVANTMSDEQAIANIMDDTTRSSLHIRSNLEFATTLESGLNNGLNFQWKYYENDTHGSVPLITEYDALRFMFPWYAFKNINQIYDPNSDTDELLNGIVSHFNNISQQFGYDVLPPAGMINDIGYTKMRIKKFEDAHLFFDLNIKNYPKVSNVYDSKGDCYLAQQDSLKALEFFTKALEVGPNNYSQPKIDAIKEGLKK
ncbi:MAG: alpha/beta hydrolase-fold protein [Reichenbachiella sp.]|uniref:alpha/beta hydrolase-fold protein n=1 Tax=Reichenbachiella sp. TaxID=2184521 RepID=UPI003298B304